MVLAYASLRVRSAEVCNVLGVSGECCLQEPHPQAAVDPLPDPNRSGPSTAIIVNGTAYIVDFEPEQGQGAALTSGR